MKPDWIKNPWRQGLKATTIVWLSGVFFLPPLLATEYGDITAVAAQTGDDYARTKLADGSYPQETYAFAPGGVWGSALHDDSMDKLKFADVAHIIARSLTEKNYLPAKAPAKTKLLIVVYWGMTMETGDTENSIIHQDAQVTNSRLQSLLNRGSDSFGELQAAKQANQSALTQADMVIPHQRRSDAQNAAILGYDTEDVVGSDYGEGLALTALRYHRNDLIEEIEDNRYFVVLLAYDFQLLWKEKKPKLLWETRYSIRQRGNDFDQALAPMTKYASRYFGQDSHGLVRRRLPLEDIKINETQFLGFVPETDPAVSSEAKDKNKPRPIQEGNPAPPLAQRIADYQQGKDALQAVLAAKLKNQTAGMNDQRTIDSFNAEHSARIASLEKEHEAIRTELAQLALAHSPANERSQSMESFLGELAADMRDIVTPAVNRKP